MGIAIRAAASAPTVLSLSPNSTKRVDHSNTRLVTQLDRNPGVYSAIQGAFRWVS